jgi:hypothetical protein
LKKTYIKEGAIFPEIILKIINNHDLTLGLESILPKINKKPSFWTGK